MTITYTNIQTELGANRYTQLADSDNDGTVSTAENAAVTAIIARVYIKIASYATNITTLRLDEIALIMSIVRLYENGTGMAPASWYDQHKEAMKELRQRQPAGVSFPCVPDEEMTEEGEDNHLITFGETQTGE